MGLRLGKVVAVNGLLIPLSANSFRAPKCSVQKVCEGGATEPSFDLGGAAPQEVVAVDGLSV